MIKRRLSEIHPIFYHTRIWQKRFFRQIAEQEAISYLSVITIGELLQGAHRAQTPEQETSISAWIERTERKFAGRILELDAPVMCLWANITASAIKRGLTAPLMDSLLAATAIQHDLVFVTRNTDDVQALGGRTVNPWKP